MNTSSYVIDRSNQDLEDIIIDAGQFNYDTTMVLFGRNTTRWGEHFNNNLLKLVSNYSSYYPPGYAGQVSKGQFWFDMNTTQLKVCISSDPLIWKIIYNKVDGVISNYVTYDDLQPLLDDYIPLVGSPRVIDHIYVTSNVTEPDQLVSKEFVDNFVCLCGILQIDKNRFVDRYGDFITGAIIVPKDNSDLRYAATLAFLENNLRMVIIRDDEIITTDTQSTKISLTHTIIRNFKNVPNVDKYNEGRAYDEIYATGSLVMKKGIRETTVTIPNVKDIFATISGCNIDNLDVGGAVTNVRSSELYHEVGDSTITVYRDNIEYDVEVYITANGVWGSVEAQHRYECPPLPENCDLEAIFNKVDVVEDVVEVVIPKELPVDEPQIPTVDITTDCIDNDKPTITGTVGTKPLESTDKFTVTIDGVEQTDVVIDGLQWSLAVKTALTPGKHDVIARRNDNEDITTNEIVICPPVDCDYELVVEEVIPETTTAAPTTVPPTTVPPTTAPPTTAPPTTAPPQIPTVNDIPECSQVLVPTITGTVGTLPLAPTDVFFVMVGTTKYTATTGLIIDGLNWSLTTKKLNNKTTYNVTATRNGKVSTKVPLTTCAPTIYGGCYLHIDAYTYPVGGYKGTDPSKFPGTTEYLVDCTAATTKYLAYRQGLATFVITTMDGTVLKDSTIQKDTGFTTIRKEILKVTITRPPVPDSATYYNYGFLLSNQGIK